MSKLSFRARALDASKPMPIYRAEELPELPDYSAINRAVPQMPSGMEKEEECEHHLQRAICTGLIIPTPEVSEVSDMQFYERVYPPDYKMPRQLIHMQPLCLEQETPEYDMDTEDEQWLRQHRAANCNSHNAHTAPPLSELEFEEIMDRLERSSGQTVIKLDDAKAMLGRDDNIMIAVYDYWLNKRLTHKQALIYEVKTESRSGSSTNNPYLAFRRRTEKMQTRKNRKNDETSYEKMVKLRRDLSRAVTLLEMVVQRERVKREQVQLTADIADKRYAARDFNGQLLAELAAVKALRPQFAVGAVSAPFRAAAPSALLAPGYRRGAGGAATPTRSGAASHLHSMRQREKRQYKKRKHRHTPSGLHELGACSSSEDDVGLGAMGSTGSLSTGTTTTPTMAADDGPFAFRRKSGVMYHKPTSTLFGDLYEVPQNTTSMKDNEDPGLRDARFRYTLTSIRHPVPRCIGFARRRMGRGGRVILDRLATPLDALLSHPDMAEPGLPWRRIYSEYLAPTDRPLSPRPEKEAREDDGEDVHRTNSVNDTLSNRDISFRFRDRTKLAVEKDIRRRMQRFKGRKFRRRLSESSTEETEDPFQIPPEETEFGKFLGEVKSEWLHFRPKTPPPVPEQDAWSQTESGSNRLGEETPLSVEMRLLGADEPPCGLLADRSPFRTGDFSLAELYGDCLLAGDPWADDPALDGLRADAPGARSRLSQERTIEDEDAEKGEDGNFLSLPRGGSGAAAEKDLSPGSRSRERSGGASAFRVLPLPPEPIFLAAGAEAPPGEAEAPPAPAAATPNGEAAPRPRDDSADRPPRDALSPKKHLLGHLTKKQESASAISSAAESPKQSKANSPQVVSVSVNVSESMKARLHGHLMAQQNNAAAGETAHLLLQNGPFTNSQVAVVNSGSPRRSIAHTNSGVLHLQTHPTHISAPIVVTQQLGLQQVSGNKLKVLHTHPLTQSQKSQLLASRQHLPTSVPLTGTLAPAVVTLTHAEHSKLQVSSGQMKAGLVEIKGGVKGQAAHNQTSTLLGVVHQGHNKRQAQVIATLDGNQVKMSQQSMSQMVVKGVNVSSSLAGTVVRASLPSSVIPRNHMRHHIQLRGPTVQLSGTSQQQKSVLTSNLVDKLRLQSVKGSSAGAVSHSQPTIVTNANLLHQQVKTSLAGAVVANLVHKPAGVVQNIQFQKTGGGQQKITISAASGQPVLSAVQHHLKHRHQGNRVVSNASGISLAAKIVQQNAQQLTSDNSGSDIEVGDASDSLVRPSLESGAVSASSVGGNSEESRLQVT